MEGLPAAVQVAFQSWEDSECRSDVEPMAESQSSQRLYVSRNISRCLQALTDKCWRVSKSPALSANHLHQQTLGTRWRLWVNTEWLICHLTKFNLLNQGGKNSIDSTTICLVYKDKTRGTTSKLYTNVQTWSKRPWPQKSVLPLVCII